MKLSKLLSTVVQPPLHLKPRLYPLFWITLFVLIHSTPANGQVFSIRTDVPMYEEGKTSWASSWGDYDNDNDLDLYVSNYYDQNFLYRNDGSGVFTKVTTGALVLSAVGHWSSTWVDYDNDKDLDLYVINSYTDNNELLRNNGNGTFTSISSVITNTSNGLGNNAAWADTDRDGDLDLFIANGSNSDVNTRNKNNSFYINNGDGTFTQNTTSIIASDGGFSQYGSFADYDNDGDPDLIVINTFQDNFFYENNGDGSFTKVFDKPFLSTGEQPLTACWGDLNNDGYADLVIGSYTDSRIYFNNGDKTFRAGTFPNLSGNATGVSLGDFNNDGFLDVLFIRTGQNSLYYLNNGDETFSNTNAGDLTSAPLDYTNTGAVADYDNDGDLDVYINNDNSTNLLFENQEVTNHWIGFRLIGRQSNWQGIGAKVMIEVNNRWQTREISTPTSYRTQSSILAHFGIGSASCIEQMRVIWPSGKIQHINTIRRRNVYLTIDEAIDCYDFGFAPPSVISNDTYTSNTSSWADYDNDGDLDVLVGNDSETNGINLYQNQGNDTFVDQAGANIPVADGNISGGTWGDFDNDGNVDLFVTNGDASEPNVLYTNNGGGAFTASVVSELAVSVGAASADFDSDGNLDIFVANNHTGQASGTNSVYLGNGMGILDRHDDEIVNSDKGIRSGAVALADIDRDGDVDVFVPTIGPEQDILYRNEGNATFTKDEAWQLKIAPSRNTNAAFGDYDNDGDADVYLSGDDVLYQNNGEGGFTEVNDTPFKNEQSKQALWGDYDNDGDLDLFLVLPGSSAHALYQNNNDGTFEKFNSSLTQASIVTGSASWTDVNNDGYLDLFLANTSENTLFLNEGGVLNSLRINLKGVQSNASGIGAVIRVKTGNIWQSRQVFSHQSNSLQSHFGLGDALTAEIVRVEWPSGNVQVLSEVDANQVLTIEEANSTNTPHAISLDLVTNEEVPIFLTTPLLEAAYGDVDGDQPKTIKIVTLPGKAQLLMDGSYVATDQIMSTAEFSRLQISPTLNTNGITSFIIESTDYRGLAVTNEVKVNIVPVNDPPSFGPFEITERDSKVMYLEGQVLDVDNSISSLIVGVSSDNQTVVSNEDLSFEVIGDKIKVKIAAFREGMATLKITAYDGTDTGTGYANLHITNTAHTMSLAFEANEDETLIFQTSTFTEAFVDNDGDQLQAIKIVKLPLNGTLVLDGVSVSNGTRINVDEINKLRFVPDFNVSGQTSFAFESIDGRDLAVEVISNIVIKSVNDAPELAAIEDREISMENIEEVITIPLVISDVDTPASSLILVASSDNQAVVADGDMSIQNAILSIKASGAGLAKITVTVTDGEKQFFGQFTVLINLITGLESEAISGFHLFPNPSDDDYVFISLSENVYPQMDYYVVDNKGMVVIKGNSSEFEDKNLIRINVDGLHPGLYLIKCLFPGGYEKNVKFFRK